MTQLSPPVCSISTLLSALLPGLCFMECAYPIGRMVQGFKQPRNSPAIVFHVLSACWEFQAAFLSAFLCASDTYHILNIDESITQHTAFCALRNKGFCVLEANFFSRHVTAGPLGVCTGPIQTWVRVRVRQSFHQMTGVFVCSLPR